jgi:hypothetical protein
MAHERRSITFYIRDGRGKEFLCTASPVPWPPPLHTRPHPWASHLKNVGRASRKCFLCPHPPVPRESTDLIVTHPPVHFIMDPAGLSATRENFLSSQNLIFICHSWRQYKFRLFLSLIAERPNRVQHGDGLILLVPWWSASVYLLGYFFKGSLMFYVSYFIPDRSFRRLNPFRSDPVPSGYGEFLTTGFRSEA